MQICTNPKQHQLLALDTTGEQCSVALLHRCGKIAAQTITAPKEQSKLILSQIQSLLNVEGVPLTALTGLVCVAGPGSFTGVRIATSVTQGLAVALNLRIAKVSSLQLLAQVAKSTAARSDFSVVALSDARMQELYCGYFHDDGGLMQHIQAETLLAYGCKADELDFAIPAFYTCPSAMQKDITTLAPWLSQAEYLPSEYDARFALVHGLKAFEKGTTLPAQKLEPSYIRKKVVRIEA